MGSYLSEPVCEKISTDESNNKLSYGASSMQGWRLSQEDAHNSILDFDTNSSLFAVYDGHGGHEVAEYCANKLPEFLKALDCYKSGDFEKALVAAFLGFDATITYSEVIAELRQIASLKPDNAEESDEDDENVSQLNQEAVMPLEEVMEKYTAITANKPVDALKKRANLQPVSPYLTARKSKDEAGGSGSRMLKRIFAGTSKNAAENASSSSSSSTTGTSEEESTSSGTSTKNGDADHEKSDVKKEELKPEAAKEENIETPDSKKKEDSESEKNGLVVPEIKVTEPESSKETEENKETEDGEITEEHQNGEMETPENNCVDKKVNDANIQENGDISKKGKGKALAKTKGVCPAVEKKPKRTSQQMYRKLLQFEEESADSDEDDEEDKSFTVVDDSSDEDEFDEEDADDEEEDLDYDEEEEEEEDEDEGECEMFMNNMKSGPGSDSGCTAVVALLVGNELIVANAGDSRCIVCRDGKAKEMSFDHKPEDAPERARVEKAGGRVTLDGRINNGLNLSRAIGDHAYKLNGDLSDREQMITALPDIKRLTIESGRDEFMVLACDGIWNYMSSDEVVEFVRNRLQAEDRPKNLSQICEEMFDHCLAPNTMGDGTGCDNMTGIIVEFKPALTTAAPAPIGALKRASSPSPDEPCKRPKTELSTTESSTSQDTATVDTEVPADV